VRQKEEFMKIGYVRVSKVRMAHIGRRDKLRGGFAAKIKDRLSVRAADFFLVNAVSDCATRRI
jgi:hypothetical protein